MNRNEAALVQLGLALMVQNAERKYLETFDRVHGQARLAEVNRMIASLEDSAKVLREDAEAKEGAAT